MKKISILLLVFALISTMIGCNQNSNNPPQDENNESTNNNEEVSDIDKKIQSMSLKEKVTQMIMPSFRYESYEVIKEKDASGKTIDKVVSTDLETMNDELKQFLEEYKFGGIILFANNFKTSKQSAELIKAIKEANAKDNDIPLLIGVDQEGGSIKRLDFGTSMVGNMALCATNNSNNALVSSEIIGEELSLLGVNLNFAPVVDINSNPANPIIGIRSFSDDPDYAADFISKSIEGYHHQNIAVSLKHFPGHGDTNVDSHTGLPLVEKDLNQLMDFELKAFKTGINSGADMIMSAHIQFPNVDDSKYNALDGSEVYLPATLSKKIIGMLRNDLGFNGVICTDALDMDAIDNYYQKEDVATLAINAGVDILLMPVDNAQDPSDYIQEIKDYIDLVVKLVEKKSIDEKLIDDAVKRILTLKQERQITDKLDINPDLTKLIGSKENHDKELDIAKEAVTLVENNNATLPLNKDNKTLVLVPYSSQINSILFAKNLLLKKDLINEDTINVVYYGDDTIDTFNLDMIKDYDSMIIISSMYGYSNLSGDNSKIIDGCLNYCKENNIKNILLSAQLPYDLSRFEANSKVAVFYGAGVNEIPTDYDNDVKTYAPNIPAAILLMYGDGNFKGKLPVDIPLVTYNQQDESYESSNEIKYQRSFGLDN